MEVCWLEYLGVLSFWGSCDEAAVLAGLRGEQSSQGLFVGHEGDVLPCPIWLVRGQLMRFLVTTCVVMISRRIIH